MLSATSEAPGEYWADVGRVGPGQQCRGRDDVAGRAGPEERGGCVGWCAATRERGIHMRHSQLAGGRGRQSPAAVMKDRVGAGNASSPNDFVAVGGMAGGGETGHASIGDADGGADGEGPLV